ncbi:efflux RND transporter periplasmic adaptor subunit [Stenotrophomonas maltophilia group sp. P373]|uniref:efflux RND transporter periplasmic adaptor subunit n=1 Tax=Stenotrophomonas maltophilia group TaxID=995085 RepID=UPI000518711B|nr:MULTISPECIES: biotin/lipoyl-binding protein [Stenotrophomonas maltophilia group]MBH1590247.1 biotin/lipoyl-binding protein [Stenotrophomonas maltophilia]MCF3524391.1 biotin/lipoyl-binding protein [Stenotrophomonas maltophilia]MCF3553134.1 biotin/lipoyl-binding protein [Stenotrophomonas maltophilia]MCU1205956.1 biotin/lipoyl-binding protein [Stenotrophomonas maltophilia]OBU68885.1 efflux transporter periplasmic adaptor subunit [Stenotrophomonas maltophilia]
MKHTLAVIGRWSATLVVFAIAVVAALAIWHRYETRPWTRDGRVRADVVRVASDMGGLVTQVLVHDNQRVSAGQLLLVLDQPRFAAALEKADAAASSARATLALARRESTRDDALGNLVASETRERNAAKVDTELAALAQARAEQRVARLNVQRTEVRATTDGIVTNLDLHAGDYLQPGAQALALIDTRSLRIEGYFEETKLACITEGDAAVARLMGDDHDVRGHVDTIAAGIADDQRSSTHNLLPAVAPTYTWVRLAQRIPVRIRIDDARPDTRLIVGRTASVTITPSAQGTCK